MRVGLAQRPAGGLGHARRAQDQARRSAHRRGCTKPDGCSALLSSAPTRSHGDSVDQLAGLCRQHAKTPLGLDDYRLLFAEGGVVDSLPVDERAEEVRRITALAAAICDVIRTRSVLFGRLSARDLFLIVAADDVADGTTEEELQGLLETLSSPLLRVLDGSPTDGYRVTTSAQVSRMRLDVVAEEMVASAQRREKSTE